jgi:hypothetical protein
LLFAGIVLQGLGSRGAERHVGAVLVGVSGLLFAALAFCLMAERPADGLGEYAAPDARCAERRRFASVARAPERSALRTARRRRAVCNTAPRQIRGHSDPTLPHRRIENR